MASEHVQQCEDPISGTVWERYCLGSDTLRWAVEALPVSLLHSHHSSMLLAAFFIPCMLYPWGCQTRAFSRLVCSNLAPFTKGTR